MLSVPSIPTAPSRRAVAGLLAAAVVASLLLGARPAAADPAPTGAASLQAQAADLAARIDALDEQLSVLAERYDQAQVVVERADAALASAQAEAAAAERAVTAARHTLKTQAVSAYVSGGSTRHIGVSTRPYRLTAEDGIRRNYTRAAVDATQRAIDVLHASQQNVEARHQQVTVAASAARNALAKARADRDAAASTEAVQRSLLAQVNGRLGALVRAEQLRRAAAEAAAAKQAALARQQASQAATRPASGSSTSASTAPRPPGSPTTSTTRAPSSGTSPSTTTTTAPPAVDPPPPSNAPLPAPNAAKANKAIAAAQAQLGKPYEWGGAGPDTFDCSGLTAWAWKAAGVYLPHSSLMQYQMLPFVPLDKLAPGDLVFYGSDIHHVGLYVGGGQMIEAPHTGANVRYASIWRSDIVGGGRPT